MSKADRFRRIADRCRSIPGRSFGLREHSVTIVYSTWTGGTLGEGEQETTEIQVTSPGGHNPKVKFPSQREIALGLMSEGQVVIGPVTPFYGPGGMDRDLLNGSQMSANESLHLRITGPQCPDGVLYRLKNVDTDQAIHVMITAVPAEAS